MNRHQLSVLFDRDIKTIGKHVNNALKEELAGISLSKFATTAVDGKSIKLNNTISAQRVFSQSTVQWYGSPDKLQIPGARAAAESYR